MQSFKNFLKSIKDKEEEKKLKENEQFLLFNPDIDEKKRKELLLMNPQLEFNIISKLLETYKQEKEEEKKKKLIDYDKYRNLYESPLILPNIFNYRQQEKIKYNFNNNTNKLKNEFTNKLYDFFANLFKSKDNKKINDNQIPMNYEEAKKIVKTNIIKKQKVKRIEVEGTGKCFELLMYLLGFSLFLFILIKSYSGVKLYKERYESEGNFDGELLKKIKNYEDIEKLGKEKIDELSLKLFNFADLPYDYGKIEKEKNFQERFKDWEIFEKNIIGKDNCFYAFKNEKFKIIIISFPGTNIASTQLLEEILGSSFKNFHINNKNILVSQYFGERISELLNYIFTPKLNELLKNDYQIISTGHSLGGAIAQAFIYFSLTENRINKKNFPMTITFNQPKVGNKIFADFLNENSLNLRFTKGTDIVSSIPFSNFGFIDMCKYIFNKRNIYNEYVHTRGYINISDSTSHNLPTSLKVIYLLLMQVSLIFYSSKLEKFISNLLIKSQIFINFLYLIYIISHIIYTYYIYKIFNIANKYYAYKFFILISIYSSCVMYFIFLIFVLLSVLIIYELSIAIYNIYIKIRNLDLKFKDSFKIDINKFKKASDEEKKSILSAFVIISGGALGVEVLNENVLSHMKTAQRTGKEEFLLNKETLEFLVNNIGEVDKEEDIGANLVIAFDKLIKNAQII